MKRLPRLAAVLSLVLATSATILAQTQKDAHIGTWKLNVAKSKFNPGPGYKSETRTYEATADGYKFQGGRVNPDGSTPKYGFTDESR
jgi:ribonuclease HII